MKKILIAVLLLGLISCENDEMLISYEITSMIQIENSNAWESSNGLKYKVIVNGEVVRDSYTEYVGISDQVELLDGDYLIIEGWTDNPNAYVDIRINRKSDMKKGYNYKKVEN